MKDRQFLYAPLAWIRSSLCPLDFRATRIAELPDFANTVQKMPAFGELQVGECLRYESLFPYVDSQKHRRHGCQLITAPFGLSPEDIDALFGIYTYVRALDRGEGIPEDRNVTVTMNVLARIAGLSQTCSKDTRRNQSRIFRLSYVKLSNTASWNSKRRCFQHLSNMDLFSIKDMSLLMEPRAPLTLQLSADFVNLIRSSPAVAFDLAKARDLGGSVKRRFFFLVNREGWNQRDSMIYDADLFTVHQLGYSQHADRSKERNRRKRRLHELRQLLKECEDRDLIRPYKPWRGYFATPTRGSLTGKLALRWSRGPAVRAKRDAKASVSLNIESDPLFDQIRALKDEKGETLPVPAYRRLLAEHGRNQLQKHVGVVVAQKRIMPGSFHRSEIAALVNRVQSDHAFPSWYTPELNRARVDFQTVDATAAVQSLYDSITRS